MRVACLSLPVLSGVRFVDLCPGEPRLPRLPRLPASPLWSPKTHRVFPPSFKRSTAALLCLAARHTGGSLPGTIPKSIWLHILSYASRSWYREGFFLCAASRFPMHS